MKSMNMHLPNGKKAGKFNIVHDSEINVCKMIKENIATRVCTISLVFKIHRQYNLSKRSLNVRRIL